VAAVFCVPARTLIISEIGYRDLEFYLMQASRWRVLGLDDLFIKWRFRRWMIVSLREPPFFGRACVGMRYAGHAWENFAAGLY
jgi:hypothetical protein